jgi:hypothetical protein
MNNSELDSVLRKARLPQPSEEFWADLPQQIARQSNRSRLENLSSRQSRFSRLAWGFATIVCILIAFAIGLWRGQDEKEANISRDILANPKLVQETLAMFPGQVRAIVEDQRGLNVVLSDTNNVPASTPLYVRVCNGKECAAVVTFSGQDIQIAGQKMTVLSDARGGIILLGSDFAWSSSQPTIAKSDLKITAKNLGLDAM